MRRILLRATLLAAAPFAAQAGELVLGAGWGDIDTADDAAAGLIEYRPDWSIDLGPVELRPLVAAYLDADLDGWVGAGVVGSVETGLAGLRFEASFAPGLYGEGDGRDLGGAAAFRSALGVSLPVTERWRVGLMAAHISNAGIYDDNPGTDMALVTATYGF